MKAWVQAVGLLLVGAALGGAITRTTMPAPPATGGGAVPEAWVARIGDHYLTVPVIAEEMRRRGGERPGLFQDTAAKRALVDELLLQQALVQAATREGLDQQRDTRRAIEQLLINRYLDGSLKKTQAALHVEPQEIQAHYDANADDYAVPARRRVAMLRLGVAKGADEAAWDAAEARANEALKKAQAQDAADFGPLALDYSDDPTSRYRGGVIGWLSDARKDSYAQDPALLDAIFDLEDAGEYSDVLRGSDAVYIARLVEVQAAQPRPLDELRAGIEQQLLQKRYAEAEAEFRRAALASAEIEVREDALAAITPLGPPASDQPPLPPAMPGDQEAPP